MKYLLAYCLVLFSMNLFSQSASIIKGTVKSGTGEPLGNANVMAKTLTADSSIVAFAFTDKNGHFEIEIPVNTAGDLLISVSIIGYISVDRVWRIGKPDYKPDFILATKALVLNEVVVREPPRQFKSKNDTTSYDVSRYSDGTERKLEDLLRKLPGIKVSENGTITFKGKAIDKIMLEGDDFFERNYKLLSKNVSTALIEKIEAIENYNDNGLLKGIQRSDKVVLNLKFKKMLVSSIFGNVEAGAGLPSRYSLNTTLFSFINKLKVAFLGNLNNTGFDALDDTKYNLGGRDGENAPINKEAGILELPIGNELMQVGGINKTRYLTNQARLGAVQISTTFWGKIKFNGYGYWQKDNRLMVNFNNSQYLLQDSVFNVREQGTNNQLPLQGFGRWKLQFPLDSVSAINYVGSYLSSSPGFQYRYLVQSAGMQENTAALVNDNNINNYHKATYVRRFSYSGALVTEIEYRQATLLQRNAVTPNRYVQLLGAGDASFSPIQSFGIKEAGYQYKTSWLGVQGKHNYELIATYNYYKSELSSDILLEKGVAVQPISNSSFINAINYRKSTWLAEVKDEVALGKWKYSAGLTARSLNIYSGETNKEKHAAYFYTEPSLAIGYLFSPKTKANIQARQVYTLSGITDLYDHFVLSDYKGFISGAPYMNKNRQLYVNLLFSHVNSDKYLFFHFNSSYQQQSRPYISSLQISDSNVSLITRIPVAAIANSFTFNAEFSKYIPVLQCRLGVNAAYLLSRLNSFINSSSLRRNTLVTINPGFFAVTAFDGWWNFDYELSYTNNKLRHTGGLTADNDLLRNSLLRQKLSSRIRLLKMLNLKVTNEQFRWHNSLGVTTTNFLDAVFKMQIPKKKYAFEIKGLNLLNNTKLVYNNISALMILQNTYELTPAYIVGTFIIDF